MEFTLEELNTDKEKRRQYIMSDLEKKMKWLEENTKHDIIYLALQGSQNYQMDVYSEEYMSDIDVKAICIPSFDDILRGSKMVSHTYIMDDNSHIDVKDIRLYIDLWKKSNPSFLEILFTEHFICKNEQFLWILDMANEIAFANKNKLFSCIKGMQMEKYKALEHPYPTIKDKIDKWGYDPKQLHHIFRLYVFAEDIIVNGKSFREALVSSEKDKTLCLRLKVEPESLESARMFADTFTRLLFDLVENWRKENEPTVDEDVYTRMESIIYNIVRDKCIEELKETN